MVEGSIGIAQLPRQGISQVNGVVLPTETWGRFNSPQLWQVSWQKYGKDRNILEHTATHRKIMGTWWEHYGNMMGRFWYVCFSKSHAGWNGVPNMETSSMRKSWLLVMKQQVAGYSLGAQGTIHRWWLSHLPLNIWNLQLSIRCRERSLCSILSKHLISTATKFLSVYEQKH